MDTTTTASTVSDEGSKKRSLNSVVEIDDTPPAPRISREDDDDDDDDVQVCSPPPKKKTAVSDNATAYSQANNNDDNNNNNNNNNNNTDDSPQVISSTLTNPNIDYSHQRVNCGVHPFSSQTAFQKCPKCYCVVCDIPAVECQDWTTHCLARPRPKDTSVSTEEVAVVEGRNMEASDFSLLGRRRRDGGRDDDFLRLMTSVNSSVDAASTRRPNQRRGGVGHERPLSEKRITDVLAEKLLQAVRIADGPPRGSSRSINRFDPMQEDDDDAPRGPSVVTQLKMEGDIGSLRLHNSFFVEGVRIGWPFSTILTPQRQMAIHIVKALKRKLHVVLESPTGTGKSAAILCSVLAWQRYHAHTRREKRPEQAAATREDDDRDVGAVVEPEVPTVIYCSRTHSQVAQMVASLQKTPYRPRMTVLGSRDRLCINQEVKAGKRGGAGINQACRDRKVETDRRRKAAFKKDSRYSDDNPWPFPITATAEVVLEDEEGVAIAAEVGIQNHRQKPSCPHYQQLTTLRNAKATQERFLWSADKINCCSSSGGEQSKLGVLDIEDLVAFGKNPYRESNLAIYRPDGHGTFGINLGTREDGGVMVGSLRLEGPGAMDGRLQDGDWILSVNGTVCRTWTIDQVVEKIRNLTQDPLVLRVQHRTSPPEDEDVDNNEDGEAHSEHAVCPYYLSRALIPSANLIFAPYNYVLDPSIRRSLNLGLKGSVVVLDEAHNIEDTLCESGSGDYSEVNLCYLISILTGYSNQKTNNREPDSRENTMELLESREKRLTSEIAHELLLFIEKVVTFMQDQRKKFELGPALTKVKQEHSRFRLSDDHSLEVAYNGPSGFGLKGEAVGCSPLLSDLGITPEICTKLTDNAKSLENHLFGGDVEKKGQDKAGEAAFNDLIEIMERFELACKHPEHYFLACNMKPNGNIDHAMEMDDDEYTEMIGRQRWRKHPRQLALTSPRTDDHRDVPLHVCNHESCRSKNAQGYFVGQAVRHGEMCKGERPRWEAHMIIRLLNPGLLMKELSTQCRTVILASGSLAPLPSLCAELNLYAPKSTTNSPSRPPLSQQPLSQSSPALKGDTKPPVFAKSSQSPAAKQQLSLTKSSTTSKANPLVGRLQVLPKPLEANHVVDLKTQLLACAIGNFPDGAPLTVSYSHYKVPSFFPRLGNALASVIEAIPTGGVLVFVPSYSFLNKCIKCWNPNIDQYGSPNQPTCPQIWSRLLRSKRKIIVEPTGSQEKFEVARHEYRRQIQVEKCCILLAVFRGKMSEGISFNDDNARAVICIGVPFPNSFDRNIKAKKAYNDEQRKIRKNTHLLPGNEWYSQQAYRAVAQALGRCIRHGADYGTVILMDSRHCDDGSPNDGIPSRHKNLPKWMRGSMRTLSMRPNSGMGDQPVLGGYRGLAQEMRRFFQQAPIQSRSVLNKWKADLEAAQQKSRASEGHVFDRATGKWSSNGPNQKPGPESKATGGVKSEI